MPSLIIYLNSLTSFKNQFMDNMYFIMFIRVVIIENIGKPVRLNIIIVENFNTVYLAMSVHICTIGYQEKYSILI
jgi:hypothetical protein